MLLLCAICPHFATVSIFDIFCIWLLCCHHYTGSVGTSGRGFKVRDPRFSYHQNVTRSCRCSPQTIPRCPKSRRDAEISALQQRMEVPFFGRNSLVKPQVFTQTPQALHGEHADREDVKVGGPNLREKRWGLTHAAAPLST